MSAAELRTLADDIAKVGLRNPIVIYKDGDTFQLLDGRNRLDAIELVLGQPVRWASHVEGRPRGLKCTVWGFEVDNEDGKSVELMGLEVTREEVDEDGEKYTCNRCVIDSPPHHDSGFYNNEHYHVIIEYDDPRESVLSYNVHRLHLSAEDKGKAAAALLKTDPTKSSNAVGKTVGLSDKTVTKIRRELEGRSEIPNVETRTDTKGRSQPAAKPKRTKAPAAPSTPQTTSVRTEVLAPQTPDPGAGATAAGGQVTYQSPWAAHGLPAPGDEDAGSGVTLAPAVDAGDDDDGDGVESTDAEFAKDQFLFTVRSMVDTGNDVIGYVKRTDPDASDELYQAVNDVIEKWEEIGQLVEPTEGPNALTRAEDYCLTHPQTTLANVVKKVGVTTSTASRAMEKVKADKEIPTEQEADESYQDTLYEQGCRFLSNMTEPTRSKFIAHVKSKGSRSKNTGANVIIRPLLDCYFVIKNELAEQEAREQFSREDKDALWRTLQQVGNGLIEDTEWLLPEPDPVTS